MIFCVARVVIASLLMGGGKTRSPWMKRAVTLVLTTAVAGAPIGTARGQTDDERAGARAAATEGAQALRDKKWSEAVDLFTRAESLVHAPPHLLYLARAHVNLGKLVKAEEEYLKVIKENLPANAPKAFHDAQADAQKELKELEPRIPYVRTVINGAARNPMVTVDGVPIPRALVGLQRPIDPGEHKFQAMAEGMVSETITMTMKEGNKETVTLALKPGTPAPIYTAGGSGPPTAGTSEEGPPRGPGQATSGTGAMTFGAGTNESSGSNGLRVASFVALGIGAAGLGVAGFFALRASGKHSEADSQFDRFCGAAATCTTASQTDIRDLDSEANDARSLANVALIAGGVGVAAGVTMFVLSAGGGRERSATRAMAVRRSSSRQQLTPWIGIQSMGLSGTF